MFINFCQIKNLLADEQLTANVFSEIENILETYTQKATYLDEFGVDKKADEFFDCGNKIVYLVQYLNIVNQRILNDIQNCSLQTLDNYTQIYKLDCIRKTFMCLPIPYNVDNLYKIFGLTEPFGFDGINYMAIGIDSPVVCNEAIVFEVQ